MAFSYGLYYLLIYYLDYRRNVYLFLTDTSVYGLVRSCQERPAGAPCGGVSCQHIYYTPSNWRHKVAQLVVFLGDPQGVVRCTLTELCDLVWGLL